MFGNYIKIAIRNILKNRLYALINIVGLSLGFAIYIFGTVLAHYERNHDAMFSKVDRIYTLGSIFSPTANVGVLGSDGVYTAFGPLLKAGIPELEGMSRTLRREYLVSVGADDYYQNIRFADPDLLNIFDLDYIEGDASALTDPSSILLTQSMAAKFFGDGPVLGKEMMLDHKHALHVRAVVKDLPQDTHFNSSVFGTPKFEAVAPLEVLSRAENYDTAGDWNNLSMGDMTYLLVPEGRDKDWLQNQVDSLYAQHYTEEAQKFISATQVRHLRDANTFFWEAIGMPVIQTIQVLGLLVLVIACVNYTNLATAQAMGRGREVGLRRTLGAKQGQLLVQFLTESVTLAFVAMLLAIAMLEMIVPAFNQALDKVLTIDYLAIAPWLLMTTLVVGVVSGGYPAYTITRTKPIEALRDGQKKSGKGKFVRSFMIGTQFAISIFMLATVLVMYFQNQKVKDTAKIFPTDQIFTLQRLDVDGVESRLEALRSELKLLPGVVDVAYSSQVPFNQSNATRKVGPISGDQNSAFSVNQVRIDYSFLKTYDIPLLAGRDVSRDVTMDLFSQDADEANVIVNELAVKKLGFASPQDAIGQSFFDFPDSRAPREYHIVGVVKDQNFLGFHNKVKPFIFYVSNNRYYGSVRVSPVGFEQTIKDIRTTWDRVIPDYPMQSEFLGETFEGVYTIYRSMNQALAVFAFFALFLALIGLFGLAAYMAQIRTKEIGIRRVMGASIPQVVRLLIWQFSRPVVWAVLVALPLSYFGANLYLDFFSDRIGMPVGIILGAGGLAVLAAWGIVAAHAVKIARSNPISALRYE